MDDPGALGRNSSRRGPSRASDRKSLLNLSLVQFTRPKRNASGRAARSAKAPKHRRAGQGQSIHSRFKCQMSTSSSRLEIPPSVTCAARSRTSAWGLDRDLGR
jgi:hypothetical protein